MQVPKIICTIQTVWLQTQPQDERTWHKLSLDCITFKISTWVLMQLLCGMLSIVQCLTSQTPRPLSPRAFAFAHLHLWSKPGTLPPSNNIACFQAVYPPSVFDAAVVCNLPTCCHSLHPQTIQGLEDHTHSWHTRHAACTTLA